MEKYVRIPLLFFALAAVLGVFLRWQFISPTPGIQYSYFLHAHSHTMFLGWVFNAIVIAFTLHFIPKANQTAFKRIFIVAQVFVVLMLISFPIQGYGFYSILFSTLHTLITFAFSFLFFQQTRTMRSTPVWFAKISLVFLVLSSLGPFSLGYLMSQGLGQTKWYYFSIYYYLHFQYNGFFLFATLSILFQLFSQKEIKYAEQRVKRIGLWLGLVSVPTYFLSVLWSTPPAWVYIVATISSIMQMAIVAMFFSTVKNILLRSFSKPSRILLGIAAICFTFKILLQVASSIPAIAMFAYEYRPLIIAYLHIVFLGMITPTLIAWYLEMKTVPTSRVGIPLVLFVVGFMATEIGLVLQPWWNLIFPTAKYFDAMHFNFYCATLLAVAVMWVSAIAIMKSDKDHILR